MPRPNTARRPFGGWALAARVNLSGGDYVFGYDESRTSASGGLSPVAPCRASDAGGVLCAAGVTSFVADLTASRFSILLVDTPIPGTFTGGPDSLKGGDGDDQLYAMAGDDTLEGGPGRDVLFAGSGDDVVNARDGASDTIRCGPGTDRAVVDSGDKLEACENVSRPASEPTSNAGGKCAGLKGEKRAACVRKACGRLKPGATPKRRAKYRACVRRVIRRA